MSIVHDAGTSTTAPGLPMARLDRRAAESTSRYVVTAVDVRGRLGDRSGLRAMDWAPGHRISVHVTAEMAIITGRADGPSAITRQGHLRLRSSDRHAPEPRGGRQGAAGRAALAGSADRLPNPRARHDAAAARSASRRWWLSMMTSPPTRKRPDLEAVRLLLAQLNIAPEDLLSAPTPRTMPTFAEYIDLVAEAVTPGTRGAYESYWRRIRRAWGNRRLDEPTPLEIKQLSERAKTTAIVRANSRGGRTAAEHVISALRCLYQHAVADGLLTDADNPAKRVAKPRRLASARHALTDPQLAAIATVASTTGNDPDLDALLIRLHTETACRRGGGLALRPIDLEQEQCLIRLWEKGETVRWQPVSPTLMHHLLHHAEERGDGDPRGPLLRYRNHKPITSRRYDHLWVRIGRYLPWVATQQISTHWIRHTTLTWVERKHGYAVAKAFAGHNDRSDAGTTTTYVRADLHEVARATAALTGEPHPLAAPPPAASGDDTPRHLVTPTGPLRPPHR